ncbi:MULTISPECIES: ABC transporter permease [Thermoactinomyces]|uniref:ABC transporter permease n=1 Tax=Thermoactinomyces daqus TaxID=1329516 RepID=A0A7W1X7Y4_9BACL|nr:MULTISPECIES: ABC transporter permease [Thermoactinomyces]MBA4541654.1 ABC transporter permease [Thermoactinomyces daqus]MBH8597651.1 ABC transporter permease [Thermoactinomyces sp. CICC 10523]MBH8603992.1 ABC transporter permease [Thermoactinomyces sp. CICC 10522]MBH8606474.1 ABC transporter permease [Thermoactinomyces sp. CICC 10521]
MPDFFRLIQNEMMKQFERTRTYVMLGFYIVVSFCSAFVLKYMEKASGRPEDLWGFFEFDSHLLPIAQILTVVIAGDIVSSEFNWGTVKMLLIRPARRIKILWAKYVTVLLFSVIFVVTLIVCSFLFGAVFFGVTSAYGSPVPLIKELITTYSLYFVEIVMMATLAFMLSAWTRSSSVAIGLSVFLVFAGAVLIEFLNMFGFAWGKYLLFANMDFTQYLSGGQPPYPGMSATFSVIVLLVYFILFHIISWWAFAKRDITV